MDTKRKSSIENKNLREKFPSLVIYHQYNLRFFILCVHIFFTPKKLDNFLFLFLNFTMFFYTNNVLLFAMLTMNSL